MACVGDYRLDKQIVLWGLKNLLAEEDVPNSTKVVSWAPTIWKQKLFTLKNLSEKWTEFVQNARENGETFAAFFASVEQVQVSEKNIWLTVKNQFYADWAMADTNLAGLKNVLDYYVELPVGTRLTVMADQSQKSVEIQQDRKAKQDKMLRRYEKQENRKGQDAVKSISAGGGSG